MLCVTCSWMCRQSLYNTCHVTVTGLKVLEDDSIEKVFYVCRYIEMSYPLSRQQEENSFSCNWAKRFGEVLCTV